MLAAMQYFSFNIACEAYWVKPKDNTLMPGLLRQFPISF